MADAAARVGDVASVARDDVEVMGHQAEGMHLPAGAGAALAERFEKRFPIRIILEEGFAAVAAIPHMIDSPRILEPKLASHAG